jgi:hypothetical protein
MNAQAFDLKKWLAVISVGGVLIYLAAKPFWAFPPAWQAAYRAVGGGLAREMQNHSVRDEGDGVEYIRPIVEPLMEDGQLIVCPHCGSPFEWRGQPPSGQRIRLHVKTRRDQVFYACCSRPGKDGRRLFVFGEIPNGMISDTYQLLSDNEVSWFFQKRKKDLTEAELERDAKAGAVR